jgi:WD40 repeat protein
MIAGDSGIVSSYDVSTHELIDVWNINANIRSLATLSLENGGFVVAVGTDRGKIFVRQDWEDSDHRCYPCGNEPIIDIKFSKNALYLAGASIDKNVYILKYRDGEFEA